MANYYCKYCGTKFSSIAGLTSQFCPKHPDGSAKGKHALYEGSEKSQYSCKFCGLKLASIASLTTQFCPRHPIGSSKGRHEPAL